MRLFHSGANSYSPRMITVVIPTLNEERSLASTLTALVPAAVEGFVREVVIVDGGSQDQTLAIADEAGTKIVKSAKGRGVQLAEGGKAAKGEWLLFLHADTVLSEGWMREAAQFIDDVDGGARPEAAAAFRFALDDIGLKPRLLERLVAVRCGLFRLPYGDQGLLIPKRLYREIGGFRPVPIMEDVDLVRRLGRGRIFPLHAKAVTSAVRFKRDGYAFRSCRNILCQVLFTCRVPHQYIARLYG